MRTLLAVSALALLAFASGCASSTMNAGAPATINASDYNPPSDDYVFVEQPAVGAAPKAAPAPMHMAAPNHEAPQGHVHAALF